MLTLQPIQAPLPLQQRSAARAGSGRAPMPCHACWPSCVVGARMRPREGRLRVVVVEQRRRAQVGPRAEAYKDARAKEPTTWTPGVAGVDRGEEGEVWVAQASEVVAKGPRAEAAGRRWRGRLSKAPLGAQAGLQRCAARRASLQQLSRAAPAPAGAVIEPADQMKLRQSGDAGLRRRSHCCSCLAGRRAARSDQRA